MSISEKLKTAIENENISYGELSKITGIPKTTIQRYAVGTTKKIPIEAIQKLETALGLKKGYLMDWDEDSYPNIKAYDENDRPYVLDEETLAMLDSLRSRPEMKVLFSVSKKATKEDILKAIKIIEALRNNEE